MRSKSTFAVLSLFLICRFSLSSGERGLSTRCAGRGTCPDSLECYQRTRCEVPVYTPLPEAEFRFISEIQGTSQVSPFLNHTVATIGVVTAIDSRLSTPSYWIQDIYEDDDPQTSEGLFLHRPTFPADGTRPAVGDIVKVSGNVNEFVQTGRENGLPVTEIAFGSAHVLVSDAKINVEPKRFRLPKLFSSFGKAYEPNPDAPRVDIIASNYTCGSQRESVLCYFESLENMVVEVDRPFTNTAELQFNEIGIINCVKDDASCAEIRAVGPKSFNPRVVLVEDDLFPKGTRALGAGMKLKPFTGIPTYRFSQYRIYNLSPLEATDEFPSKKVKACKEGATSTGLLRVSAWNVLNLDAKDAPESFELVGRNIAKLQRCPDIVGFSEIGDNDGVTQSEVTDASVALELVANACSKACGVPYVITDIAPIDDADGGVPGENIRVALMYRTDKVELVKGIKGNATESVAYDPETDGLTLNPGRVDPASFNDSRKPLAGEFRFVGSKKRSFIVVVNHWTSKFGDDTIYSRRQPAVQPSLGQRGIEAAAVKRFVTSMPASKVVIVLGDLNDFHFSPPLKDIGSVMRNLWKKTERNERFSVAFSGRFQTLDHILIRGRVRSVEFCAVHTSTLVPFGTGFWISDHDALVAMLKL